jgi:hypothetical protein
LKRCCGAERISDARKNAGFKINNVGGGRSPRYALAHGVYEERLLRPHGPGRRAMSKKEPLSSHLIVDPAARCRRRTPLLGWLPRGLDPPVNAFWSPLLTGGADLSRGVPSLILYSGLFGAPEEIRTPDPQIRSLIVPAARFARWCAENTVKIATAAKRRLTS